MSSGADCGEDGLGGPPVSRVGNWIRTVSRGFTLGSGGFVGGGTGRLMRTVSFFGWSGSAIIVGEIDQKSPNLSLANLAAQENVTRARFSSVVGELCRIIRHFGSEIVSAHDAHATRVFRPSSGAARPSKLAAFRELLEFYDCLMSISDFAFRG